MSYIRTVVTKTVVNQTLQRSYKMIELGKLCRLPIQWRCKNGQTLLILQRNFTGGAFDIFAFDSRIMFEAKVVPRLLNRRFIGRMTHSISAAVTFCVCQQIGKMSHSISAAVTFCVCHQTQGWICASETFWLFLQVRSTLCFSSWQLGFLPLFYADFRQIYNVSTVESTKWDGLSCLWGQGWSRGEKEW